MDTLDLPTGETVTTEDVFHYEGYPYRFRPSDDPETAFVLVPLYWGGSGMDVRVPSREAFGAEWSDRSRGVLSDDEWRAWLADAREDDRYGDEELDAVARELGVAADSGLLARLRRALGG
ncbi:hypothetical protein [Halosegnis marinus]|uniref:Alpha/beta hydrolase n=1 Tax=Halosegnis marinus TaxID=3034023 RepID=A0ABD5ZLT7_9EURY|nr:hypothetical protein [Halosegnis sp. DT85]